MFIRLSLVRSLIVVSYVIAVTGFGIVRADGPQDNIPQDVRRIPKLGVEVPADQRMELENGLGKLNSAIQDLQKKKDAKVQQLLPDVQIYQRAVSDALMYQEFFDVKEIGGAIELLNEGLQRAEQLSKGDAPWTTATGLVVRGYVSKIDGSVQPYGLVIPPSYSATGSGRFRLDLWFHGRGEVLSEVNFLRDRRKQVGTFAPADTIVLHPYGRYCNANKFAGEIDVLEAMESVQKSYRIDADRITSRGFSMGGAAAWQMAVHYADHFAAANPGAGFSETPEFLKVFQKETLKPTWYEMKLWHWYDCTDWAVNLYHCPTIAYSGEIDSQKQAADIMEQALAKEKIDLVHIIGPKTAHAYHPGARDEVERRMASVVSVGRERVPRELHFVTYTLRYNRMNWLTVDAMEEHWEKTRVDGKLVSGGVELKTSRVTGLTLSMPSGLAPFDMTKEVEVTLDGQKLNGGRPKSDRSWHASFHKVAGRWNLGAAQPAQAKSHGLQGPIDEAFMDSFVFVKPTGKCRNETIQKWVDSEFARAVEHWRRHFRGHARVKDDTQITDDDIANHNLVLWGDSQSNHLISKIDSRLPIRAVGQDLVVGDRKFAAEHHVPILVYPNPLNPKRYVVLNSSFTFREFAYLNNARQVAKLPDWAIIDVRTAPNPLWPGLVADADFFDENWQLKAPHRE